MKDTVFATKRPGCYMPGCESPAFRHVTKARQRGGLGFRMRQRLYFYSCLEHMEDLMPGFRHKQALQILKGV